MPSTNERQAQINRTRRHFLGLAAAAGTKITAASILAATTIFPASMAQAMGRPWWKKRGGTEGDPMCFLRGTSIMTPTGEVCIEDLQIGDLVETVRGETLAIKWIGRHLYRRTGSSWNDSVVPIRIARHALDPQTPHRDLYLSPGHALLIDGVLMRAKELVNGMSIAPALSLDWQSIEYFQIVLDSHEVIMAEGVAAETFLLAGDNYEGFTNSAEFARLYAEQPRPEMRPFAPIVSLDSGREHLKALLPSEVRRIFQIRRPVHDASTRIAAQSAA